MSIAVVQGFHHVSQAKSPAEDNPEALNHANTMSGHVGNAASTAWQSIHSIKGGRNDVVPY
jgi:hypothetical protein